MSASPAADQLASKARAGDFVRLEQRLEDGSIRGKGTFNRATATALSLGENGELFRTASGNFVHCDPALDGLFMSITSEDARNLALTNAPEQAVDFLAGPKVDRPGRPRLGGESLSIRLPHAVLASLDAHRGELTRRQYIERVVTEHLEADAPADDPLT